MKVLFYASLNQFSTFLSGTANITSFQLTNHVTKTSEKKFHICFFGKLTTQIICFQTSSSFLYKAVI
jgi:hypothetical protein